jgi:hypothetical protein
LRDGFVEVKFKPPAGSEYQADGLVWRCDRVRGNVSGGSRGQDNNAAFNRSFIRDEYFNGLPVAQGAFLQVFARRT